jgi:predicted nucleic acid-binding protein
VVVDTDVFSYVFSRRPEAERFRRHLEGRIAILSFQSVAELLYGAKIANWGPRRVSEISDAMKAYVIAPPSIDLAETWATIRAERRARGREMPVADAWIAATAVSLGCPVVTNNHRDFADVIGLVVLDGHPG